MVVPWTMPCGPMYMYEPAVICPYCVTPSAFIRAKSCWDEWFGMTMPLVTTTRGLAGLEGKRPRGAGVHREALFVGHGGEVTHRQPILGPILEDRAVAAVGDQLVGELSDGRVKVVHDHQHDGCGLPALCRICVDRVRLHGNGSRPVTVHDDAPVMLQLLEKFTCHFIVMSFGQVPEGVFERQSTL